jgi:hypothetical protein
MLSDLAEEQTRFRTITINKQVNSIDILKHFKEWTIFTASGKRYMLMDSDGFG